MLPHPVVVHRAILKESLEGVPLLLLLGVKIIISLFLLYGRHTSCLQCPKLVVLVRKKLALCGRSLISRIHYIHVHIDALV